jgi:pSer/pThr/pTyr-binding forkhead associated (FHA) protein
VDTGHPVSRHHARLLFRDCGRIIHDLQSMNGTAVNGVRVGRSRIYPGDRLLLGRQAVVLD